ncbi:MAG: hypothetical protein ACRCZH_07985 [Cetobacterium sp.]
MKNSIFIIFILTVILIKVESQKGYLKKYVKVSNSEAKVEFKVLSIERGL